MSLEPPAKVRKLQTALQAKAKAAPSYRFYLLYDKVYRADVLAHAYQVCRSHQGAPGVDGQDFADIEAYGLERWLGERAQELREKTYRPQAVRRVWIPKPDGKQRPLGIPTIRDRVVQTAAMLVLEPIFEADLPPEQYAYRAQRSALDAVDHVRRLLDTGHRQVVDADLSGYFDSIPHTELMKSVARRISDRHMLHLMKMWLEMPVEEDDGRGRNVRTTRNRDEHRGTPQGAPISPLLANLYMRRFVLGWKTLGHARRLKAHIVNYADDFVICCRGTAAEAMAVMEAIMTRLKLTVNATKTRRCHVPEETFDFLGYTFGRRISTRTHRAYLTVWPARKRVRRLCDEINRLTDRSHRYRSHEEQIGALNRMLRGWAGYFRLGTVRPAYRAVNQHVLFRLRQWLRGKHKLRGGVHAQFPAERLYDEWGLVNLERLIPRRPWAKA